MTTTMIRSAQSGSSRELHVTPQIDGKLNVLVRDGTVNVGVGGPLGITISDEDATRLRDEIDAHLNRDLTQTFTVTIAVSDVNVKRFGPVNVHQVKNHLRKYVAEALGCPKLGVSAWVKEGGTT